MSKKSDLDYVRRLRAEIEDKLTHIGREPRLRKGKVQEILRSLGGSTLPADPVTYLVKVGLVNPKITSGDRDSHLYGREHIRDIMLIHDLHQEGFGDDVGLSYTEIACLLPRLSRYNSMSETRTESFEVGVPLQQERALYTLRSRILGYLLAWLLGKQPTGGIVIHIRVYPNGFRRLPAGETRIDDSWLDWKQAHDQVGDIREADLLGRVTSEGEILLRNDHIKDFRSFSDHNNWLRLVIESGRFENNYELNLGFPHQPAAVNISIPDDPIKKEAMALLVKATMVTPLLRGGGKRGSESKDRSSDYLEDLVEVIKALSPIWEYCAVFIPHAEDPSRLKLVAKSHDFPRSVRPDVTVEIGQPLIGWAYQQDYPIVVQKTVKPGDDPRIAYQNIEHATAAMAIPTHARRQCNGVLYIGTRFSLETHDGQAFSEAEMLILPQLADVCGEIIEKNHIRSDAEKLSIEVVNKPLLVERRWGELKPEIENILKSLDTLSDLSRDDDNLHLTIISIETSEKLRQERPVIADWIDEHIVQKTHEFYLRHQLGNPLIFRRHDRKWDEFVCLLPRLRISDDRDRKLRDALRELLNSITLVYSFQKQEEVRVYVWSLPFRLGTLQKRIRRYMEQPIHSNAAAYGAQELVREVHEALSVLSYIEEGHRFEKNGDFARALEVYMTAEYIARGNRYLMRHIAKTYDKLGDIDSLKKAKEWWERLLKVDRNPTHYKRYAFTLARLGQFEEAEKHYQLALELEPDNQGILLALGDLMLARCKFAAARQHYEKGVALSRDNRDLFWLRIAETYLATQQIAEAKGITHLVLMRQSENIESQRLMLAILRKESGMTKMSEVG